MLRANAAGDLRDSAGRHPQGSGDAGRISTTARTSNSTRTKTSAASCSSCSRWASATTRSATSARPRARSRAGPTTCWSSSSIRTLHDFGDKTFLGRTGPFNGDDVIDIILKQPVTARIRRRRRSTASSCARTCRRRSRAELGRTYRDSGYQMKPLLKQIFLSKDFYSAASFATQIKSPVQLVVSTYRKMGLREAADDSGFRPDDRQPRPGAVRSAQRRRLGRRAHLDHAGHACCSAGNLFRDVLFPDVKNFRPPDRAHAGHLRARRRAARRGMNITEATKETDAPASRWPSPTSMVDRDEDYNTRYASYRGYVIGVRADQDRFRGGLRTSISRR